VRDPLGHAHAKRKKLILFWGRDFSTTELSLTHQAEADRVEDVKPVPSPPRKIGEVPGHEGIRFDHGLCKRLFRRPIPAEEGLHRGRRVAVDRKPLPLSPCLDKARQLLQIVAKERLRVERFLYHEHGRPILLQDASEILPNLPLHVPIRKCFDAVPNKVLAFQDCDAQVLQTGVDRENASWGQWRHKLGALTWARLVTWALALAIPTST